MDILKLTVEQLNQCDANAVIQLEKEIRREQALMRMDIYGNGKSSKKHALKRSLARVLTQKNKL